MEPQGSRLCPALGSHPSLSPSPGSVTCAPSHHSDAPHSQTSFGKHSHLDSTEVKQIKLSAQCHMIVPNSTETHMKVMCL